MSDLSSNGVEAWHAPKLQRLVAQAAQSGGKNKNDGTKSLS